MKSETKNCPYCKEEIKADAVKCKHCHSAVTPENSNHEGTCPYCKEKIHIDALKCKHCKSMLGGADPGGIRVMESGCSGIENQVHDSMLDDPGQFNMGGALIPGFSFAQQQPGFGGFSIRCFYLGRFLGRWCCLYFRGKLVNCVNMQAASNTVIDS